MKCCTSCGESKPLAAFYLAKLGRQGRRAECKVCSERDRRARTGAKELGPRPKTGLRRCSVCDEIKLLDDFYPDNKYGWESKCKECAKERRRREHAANPEKGRRASREWYDANREYAQALGREQAAAWRAKNRERHRESSRNYRQDPTKRDILRAQAHKKRAVKAGAFVEHVEPLVVLELDDGVCGICGHDVDPTNFHVDHVIPLARGGPHSYANTQTAHPLCNERKSAQILD